MKSNPNQTGTNAQQNAVPINGKINIAKWINEGWDIVMANFAEFFIISLIYVIVLIATSSTLIVKFLFTGPLTVGVFLIIFNKMRGKPIQIGDIAKGFNFFVAAVLADILVTVLVGLGFIFLIIPGIILSAMYMFTFPLILEKKMDFWQAMETSRKLVTKNLFELSVFMLMLYILMFVGFLLFLVGFLVALPITFAAIAAAYRDLFGLESTE
ncbi:MAG TPA: hypothetical protein ENN22_10020 [bacterium]|nr:hypothetical protein [bacterium]